jgi:HEPN domain-containing protein
MNKVPRWNTGSVVVERLLEAHQLQRVPAHPETVEGLIESARRRVATASTATVDDPEGSFALAYDAARKAATSLLAHQGLRPTTTGGHVVIVEVMNAQFPGIAGLKSIDRLRRRRNQAEYPDPTNYDPVTTEEAVDAIKAAGECIEAAARLVAAPQLGVF